MDAFLITFWSIPNTCLAASSSFQFPLDGTGNNPYCPVLSRNIAASQSPAKSVFMLSRAVPQISPVAGFCTLYLTACFSPAIHLPSSLLHWCMSWGPAPSPPCPGQQGWASHWGKGMQTCFQQPCPCPHSAQQLRRVSQPSQGGNTSTWVAGCGPNLSSQ